MIHHRASTGNAGPGLRCWPRLCPNLAEDRGLANGTPRAGLKENPGDYLLQQGSTTRYIVPNMKYSFVTMPEGTVYLHNRFRHPPLADGKAVIYAGEACFHNGQLQSWSNASGHYRPDDDAKQAGFPRRSSIPTRTSSRASDKIYGGSGPVVGCIRLRPGRTAPQHSSRPPRCGRPSLHRQRVPRGEQVRTRTVHERQHPRVAPVDAPSRAAQGVSGGDQSGY